MAAYKILHVVNYLIPNSGYQEPKLMREFSLIENAEYYVVSVAKNYPCDGGYETLADMFEQRDIDPGIYEEEGVKSYRLEASFEKRQRIWLKGLYGVIKEVNPDVIFVHGATNLNTLRVAIHKKFISDKKYRLIVDDHVSLSLVNSSLAGRCFFLFYRLFFAKFLSSQTNLFIPVLANIKDVMTDTYGLTGDFKVIEHGADQSNFYPSSELRRQFRSDYNIDDEQILMVYTGRIIKEKKVHLLVDAFFELHSANADIKLMIVGFADKDYLQTLRDKCVSYYISSSVIFVDAVENSELGKVYNGADFVVWPEGVTMSSLESSMCGLPAIMKNLPVNAERLHYGGSGVLFDQDEDMIECMRELITDGDLRQLLSLECLKYSDERSWSKKAALFHKVSIE